MRCLSTTRVGMYMAACNNPFRQGVGSYTATAACLAAGTAAEPAPTAVPSATLGTAETGRDVAAAAVVGPTSRCLWYRGQAARW